jgi:hypothetical protein
MLCASNILHCWCNFHRGVGNPVAESRAYTYGRVFETSPVRLRGAPGAGCVPGEGKDASQTGELEHIRLAFLPPEQTDIWTQ